MYDPEVRTRPHKKGWHISEENANKATKYHGGSFGWVAPTRYKYVSDIINNKWEEAPIPKLNGEGDPNPRGIYTPT